MCCVYICALYIKYRWEVSSPPSHQESNLPGWRHTVPTENIHPSPNHAPIRAVSCYSCPCVQTSMPSLEGRLTFFFLSFKKLWQTTLHIKLTILSVRFNGMKYIHIVAQRLTLIPELFHLPKMKLLRTNSPFFPPHQSLATIVLLSFCPHEFDYSKYLI